MMEPFTFASSSQLRIPVGVKVWVAFVERSSLPAGLKD